MKKPKPDDPIPITEPDHEPSRAERQAATVAEFYLVLVKRGLSPVCACELTRVWIGTWKVKTVEPVEVSPKTGD